MKWYKIDVKFSSKGFKTNAIFTFVSRVTGFIRDIFLHILVQLFIQIYFL